MTEQHPFSAGSADDDLSPEVASAEPASVIEAEPVAPRTRSSHSRIAALSIAAAVLLTTGAGAGAWGATALSNAGATTTAVGGTQTAPGGTGTSGGSFGSGSSGSGSTDGFGAQAGPGSQGGFGSRGGFGQGSGSSSGSASIDSSTATATQIQGVVTIVSQLGYQDGESAGTGIVLTSSGRILTNNHVIDGSTSIEVTDEVTGKSYTATVVGTNATKDIAVLQLTGASGLRAATIASTAAAQGDAVTAVGNAEGTGTLTAASGTVTDTDQQITTQSEGSAAGETLDGLIETDADVVSGDSGGPLKNSSGQVVGIDTAASSGSSDITGYAIPITTALSVAEQILAGQDTAEITIGLPAFIGVSLDSTATGTSGAAIAGVLSGTPAATSGLAEGDVITAVDGTTIDSADALSTAIGEHSPGDTVQIAYTDANGASQSTSVTLIAGPAD